MKALNKTIKNIQAVLTGEKTISEYNKYRFICLALAVIHIGLSVRFYFFKYTILFIYNLFAIALYFTLATVYAKQDKYIFIYHCTYAEITFFASYATLLAGWDWGFMIYLFALTPVSFYLAYSSPQFEKSIKKPVMFVLISMFVYIGIKILCVYIEPIYTQRPYDQSLTGMYVFNSILTFFSLLLFSILFTIEIRQNELRLEEQYALLENISSKDPLTGLINRRSMDKYLTKAVDSSRQKGHIFSVILGDIDDFKKVNDTYGHNIGDAVLVNVAKTIKETVSPGCEICRWGGEEILIYVPENKKTTKELGEKIRQAISKISVPTENKNELIHITMTFGLAEYSPGIALNKMVSIADSRLYYGKHHGKNQVVDKVEE